MCILLHQVLLSLYSSDLRRVQVASRYVVLLARPNPYWYTDRGWVWLARLASNSSIHVDPGEQVKQRHNSDFSLVYRPFITPQELLVLSLTWLSHDETNASSYRGTRAGRKCHERYRHFITESRLILMPNWAWFVIWGSVFLSCHRDRSSRC